VTHAFICDAVRTPFGRYGGALRSVRADDLAAIPIAALIARHPDVDWSAVDDVYLGCANQAGEDNRNVARMASLLAGLPVGVPARPSTVFAVPGSTRSRSRRARSRPAKAISSSRAASRA
jgi:acetyl-CoA acyltransferase